ncbi:MAG: hypothetical protein DYG96_09025 [Chlorobi bacterium CHB2]|nr:hypothetical protein [Chlorobi bacterium CHB2]
MKQLLLSALLLCFGSASMMVAQSDVGKELTDPPKPAFVLGITGGLLRSSHTGGGITGGADTIRTVAVGKLGFSVGLVAEQSLGQWLSLGGRLEYRSMPGAIYQAPPGTEVLLPESGVTVIDTVTTSILEYQILSAELTAVARPLRLASGVTLLCGAGASIATPLNGRRTRYRGHVSYPQSTPLEEAAAVQQEGGNHAMLSNEEPLPMLQDLRLGVVGTVGVRLECGGTSIIPNISYDHSLTNVTSRTEEKDWRAHSLAFRMDVRMEL